MRQQLGLIAVCGAATLLLALLIGLIYRSLPPELAIAIIVLPSVVAACAGGLSWNVSSDNKQQHAMLAKEVAELKQDVDALKGMLDIRMTQLIVATADEQRAQGKIEGVASVALNPDQTAIAIRQADVIVETAKETARVLIATATESARVLLETARVTAQTQANTLAIQALQGQSSAVTETTVANGATDARLENIEMNTAATVQAIKDNHV